MCSALGIVDSANARICVWSGICSPWRIRVAARIQSWLHQIYMYNHLLVGLSAVKSCIYAASVHCICVVCVMCFNVLKLKTEDGTRWIVEVPVKYSAVRRLFDTRRISTSPKQSKRQTFCSQFASNIVTLEMVSRNVFLSLSCCWTGGQHDHDWAADFGSINRLYVQ